MNVGRTPRMYVYINVVKSLNHNLYSHAFCEAKFHTLHFLEKGSMFIIQVHNAAKMKVTKKRVYCEIENTF